MAPPSNRPNERLRQERLLRGWSQKDVADRIGASYYYLSRWERGTTTPSPYYRQKLCALFEKNAAELGLIDDDEPEVQGAPHQSLQRPEDAEAASRASSRIFDPLIPLPATGSARLVGRDELLATLQRRLCDGQLPIIAGVYGLPGVGKTALAAALAHNSAIQAHFTDGLLWAGLGPQPAVASVLSHWGALLGVEPPPSSGQQPNAEAWAATLRRAIGNRRMLLVLDDAWHLEDLLAFQIGGPFCAYIATTRFPQIALQFANDAAIALEELNERGSIALLTQIVPHLAGDESGTLAELAHTVGGLPLALLLLGKYLLSQTHNRQPRRIRASIELLRNAQTRLHLSLPQALVNRSPAHSEQPAISLQTVIATSDQKLDEQQRAVLRALSVFPAKPNTFSEEAALAVADADVDALDKLSDAGLLESRGADRYTLHQTIADYALAALTDPRPYQRLVSYFANFVEARQQDYTTLDQEMTNILSALEAAFAHHLERDLIRGVRACYPFFDARGLYDLAQHHLEQAESSCRAIHDDIALISILHLSGKIAEQHSDFARAERLYREGLQLARENGQQQDQGLLLSAITTLIVRLGDYKRVQGPLDEALALADQINDAGLSIRILTILGCIANEHGHFSQGENYLLEALALTRSSGYQEKLYQILNNLSSSTAEQGKYGEAEAYLLEAVELARQQEHREKRCASLSNLGAVYSLQEKHDQAEEVLQEALAIAKQLGNDEWKALALNNLGEIERKRGNLAAAATFLQEGLALAYMLGQNWLIFATLMELGEVSLQQGYLLSAHDSFDKVRTWASSENSLSLLADALYGLARVALADGDHAQALTLGREALATFESCNHWKCAELRNWLQAFHD
jgi:transcriptional regulator with XRE-family HTH domain/Tfp pilus assembly protein PilF